MKLIVILVLLVSLLGIEGQSCDSIGSLRYKTDSFLIFSYNVTQVCSEITGSLRWTYICYDSNWNLNSLDIYCREFGFLRAKIISSLDTGSYRTTFSYEEGEDKLEHVDCTGEEETLLGCDYDVTSPSCNLVEYNPSDHCTNDPVPTDATPVSTTSLSTNIPVDTTTLSTTSLSTNIPTDTTTLSTTSSSTNSPTDTTTISTTSSTTNIPTDTTTLSTTSSTTNIPVDTTTLSTTSTNSPKTQSSVDISTLLEQTTSASIAMIAETFESTTVTSNSPSTEGISALNQDKLVIVLPVLAIVLTISTILIVVIIILLFYRRHIRKNKSKADSHYYNMPVLPKENASPSTQQHINCVGLLNESQFQDSNIYATISEGYKTNLEYSVVKETPLESQYEVCIGANTMESYYLEANGLYSGFIEGEVGDSDLYGYLDQQAHQRLAQGLAAFENTHYLNIVTNLHNGCESHYIEPPNNLPELEDFYGHCMHEIGREKIKLEKEFASGQFGVVYRAVYHTEKGDIPVAIKTLKEASNPDTKVAFMREAAILAQFKHPNVLRMIGVLTTQQPYMMVTELLKTELGDLLRNMKSGNVHEKEDISPLLLRFSQEISAGMKHLSEKHFIHRDLAARNVLVAKDLSCRIADFGMSRELNSDSEYYTSSGGRIPLRWTAPEAVFYKKYSEKSDVWSFGMTLFEIWSLGEKPWGNDATNEVIVEGMSTGRKLSPPTGCPRDVYSVMVDTWRMEYSSRPTFSEILHQLTSIYLSAPSPLSVATDPSQCLGSDLSLSKDHYLDLQQVY